MFVSGKGFREGGQALRWFARYFFGDRAGFTTWSLLVLESSSICDDTKIDTSVFVSQARIWPSFIYILVRYQSGSSTHHKWSVNPDGSAMPSESMSSWKPSRNLTIWRTLVFLFH